MLQLEHIQYLFGLLLLLPVIALFIGILYWKRGIKARLGNPRLVNRLMAGYSSMRFKTKMILVFLALALGFIAAANLRKPADNAEQQGAGVDVMIVLDVSKSMLSQDIKPTRLDKAKQFINTLLPQLENNRVGLVVFAGQPVLQMPLTPDVSATRMFIANASTDAVPVQGTVFGEALMLANTSMDIQEKRFKTAILVSDGEDNDPGAEEAIKDLQQSGVIVHAVGIGSPEGSNIFEPGSDEPKRDIEGNIIVSSLNESLLQQIAKSTNGSYSRLEQVNASASYIAEQVNNMEKKGIAAGGALNYKNYFPYMLAVVVMLLLVEYFIPERKRSLA